MAFNTTYMRFVRFGLIAILTIILSGCSIFGGKSKKEKLAYIERPAELIYNQAIDRVEKNDWEEANLFFQEML